MVHYKSRQTDDYSRQVQVMDSLLPLSVEQMCKTCHVHTIQHCSTETQITEQLCLCDNTTICVKAADELICIAIIICHHLEYVVVFIFHCFYLHKVVYVDPTTIR